ncbi:borealin [Ambystoma mexicanum]|uniref:borealin n=1 Tax=Ambystoma mexicanum TaxID=8296 RepID=UPI0037E94BD9
MAPPRKRTTNRRKNRTVKNEKLISFLKDFDSQVRTITEQIKADQMKLLKEIDGLYNIEVLKWPVKMREMNWLECFDRGGGQRALEEAAKAKFAIEEINILTAKVTTPFKSAKKVKRLKKVDAIDEDIENAFESGTLKTQAKAKATGKKVPTSSKKLGVLSSNNLNTSKRSSKRNLVTPGNKSSDFTWGITPVSTSRIDTRIFQTPALRTPGVKEQVYTFSANGSPLADINNLYINVPVKGGETVRLLPNDMDTMDVSALDQETRDNIQLLASRLAKIAGKIKNQR